MQSIALEAGIDPAAVASAAAALDVVPAQPLRTSWGMPVEVGRTVSLPRALTDHEWEQLVAELRKTFRANGKITTHGGLKEWSNGNLHVSVEPAETGYRIRMGTLKGNATAVNVLGAGGVVASLVTFASLAFWGAPASFGDAMLYLGPMLLGGGGLSALVINKLRLPRWALERQQQMSHIDRTIRSIMGNREQKSVEE